MWLFTKYGFYSAVSARKGPKLNAPIDPDRVMVRARKKEHLEVLSERFTIDIKPDDVSDPLDWLKVKAVEFKHSDYPWRVFLPKAVWADAVADLTREILYDNFKGVVHKELDDKEYEDVLHAVWSVGLRLQRPKFKDEDDDVKAYWDAVDRRNRRESPR